MATLKTSGLATNALTCVMVDDDNTTKDLVAGTSFALDGSCPGIGTGAWKGTTRKYQPTAANGGFNYYGFRYPTTPPTMPVDGAGCAIFLALHAAVAPGGSGDIIDTADSGGRTNWDRQGAGGLPRILAAGQLERTGVTVWPTDGTKISVGINHRRNVETSIWYCLESVNAVATSKDFDATGGQGDNGGQSPLHGIGGLSGQGNSVMSIYLAVMFNRVLTIAEWRTLHDDWYGTLFDAGAATFVDDDPGGSILIPSREPNRVSVW